MYLKLMENFVIILKDPKINNGLSRFFFLGMTNKCNPLMYLNLMENVVIILNDPKINNSFLFQTILSNPPIESQASVHIWWAAMNHAKINNGFLFQTIFSNPPVESQASVHIWWASMIKHALIHLFFFSQASYHQMRSVINHASTG